MTLEELKRLELIQRAESRMMTVHQASLELSLSLRQLRRLIKSYRLKGAAGLVHGNRGKSSPHRLSPELELRITELIRNNYRDYNTLHLCQVLKETHGIDISYASLYRLRQRTYLSGPRTRRAPRHRSRREPEQMAGAMLQADGSTHAWLEERGPHLTLVAYIDDATNEVVAATFREHEDAAGYMLGLREICLARGLPLAIYADRHTIFQSPAKATIDQVLAGQKPMSQLGRALDQLSIRLIAAHSPQAKGRVERLFQTLQDRLVKFLRTHQVTTLREANRLLSEYLTRHNAHFCHPAYAGGSAYRAWPAGLDPDDVLCFQYERQVASDNTITFDGHKLQIPPGPNRRSYSHARVRVQLHLQGHLTVHYQAEQIASFMPRDDGPVRVDHFVSAIEYQTPVEFRQEMPAPSKPRSVTKPAANHPWRRIPINLPKE
jgi:transposase